MTKEVKIKKLEKHFKSCLEIMNFDLSNPNFTETPNRIAKMWVNELFSDVDFVPSAFPNDSDPYTEVTVENISFSSMCAHHFLPFSGTVKITYVPKKWILGLSKFSRVVSSVSKTATTQEYITQEIVRVLQSILGKDIPITVEVIASHGCMTCRGVKDINSTTTTKSSVNTH